MGKRWGLSEDRRVRMRAVQNGFEGAEEEARSAEGSLRRRRGLVWGPGLFSLYHFLRPRAHARFSRLASWAVGGAPSERERMGGGFAEWEIPSDLKS